ncbi:metallophosphoesterase [Sorangium sp. So ce128]|uniref:metallophosphoesterase n=1 Tax=Sorangium sp. So ce128 TaxID=3133281 RepID=UPI003F61ECFD
MIRNIGPGEDTAVEPAFLYNTRTSMTSSTIVAVVGDVHGAMHSMVELLDAWEHRHRRHIDFVLQVGDFEPHRHEDDLATASLPQKYRDLGDFWAFDQGMASFEWPIYFIGGNHEPYGFLDQFPKGGELAPNCYYLGRVGRVEVAGLRVVGLSGIYSEGALAWRPPLREIKSQKKKLFAYYTEDEVMKAASYGSCDILVLHEWPRGAIEPEQEAELAGMRRAHRPEQVGSELARLVVDSLRPKLVVAGHMHWRHRSRIGPSAFAAMGHIDTGEDALGVFEARADGSIVELV